MTTGTADDTTQTRDARLEIVPIPLGDYVDHARNPPFDADAEAVALTGLLADRLGGTVIPWPVPSADRDLAAVGTRLTAWAKPAEPRNSILAWISHGTSNDTDAILIVPGEDGAPADEDFLPEDLARRLLKALRRSPDDSEQWTVVLIEACGAGRFIERVAAALDNAGNAERLLLIGVGQRTGRGYLAKAREVLTNVLDSYPSNHEVIRLADLANRIETRFRPLARVRLLSLADSAITRPALRISAPLDVYAEVERALAALSPAERAHFARKGMGADYGEVAWHFVGRDRELATLDRWLDDKPSDLLVVTGRAGTGKSAVLGNLLIRDRPALRDVLASAGILAAADTADGTEPRIDLSLHLTGMTFRDAVADVADVADAAGVPLRQHAPDGTLHGDQHLAGQLTDALSERSQPLCVLADALDEAQDPLTTARLLRDVAASPGVHVIVGTRASTREGPDQPDPDDTDLLDALGHSGPGVATLTVERDPGALRRYVAERLRPLDDGTPGRADLLAGIAARVAAPHPTTGCSREFLFARLAVYELLAGPGLLDRHDSLAELLDGDHRALFALAMDRLQSTSPVARVLLTALAFAQGRGLPRADKIWATAGRAILGATGSGSGASHRAETDEDATEIADITDYGFIEEQLSEALDLAAPYILLDAEDGQSVYRLAHRTFQEFFLEGATADEHARDVATGLVVLAQRALAAGTSLNPYLVGHLAEHASAAGASGWRLLAENVDVLDSLDPRRVAAEAMRTGFGHLDLPDEILAVTAAAHLLAEADAGDRPGLRKLFMSVHGANPVTPATAQSHSH